MSRPAGRPASASEQAWNSKGWTARRGPVQRAETFTRIEIPAVVPVPLPTPDTPSERSVERPAPRSRRDLTWIDLAACDGAPLELFYPGKGGTSRPAKAYCGGCPVRDPCLDAADGFGVWGGKSESERRAAKRAGRRAS